MSLVSTKLSSKLEAERAKKKEEEKKHKVAVFWSAVTKMTIKYKLVLAMNGVSVTNTVLAIYAL